MFEGYLELDFINDTNVAKGLFDKKNIFAGLSDVFFDKFVFKKLNYNDLNLVFCFIKYYCIFIG